MKKIFILFVGITMMSCVTKIGDLKLNPRKYAGQTVSVRGTISKIVTIPFTDYTIFEIRDKSDKIVVFSIQNHNKNDSLTIEAKVVAFDNNNLKQSTLETITAIEEFLIEKNLFSKEDVKKPAELIGNTISKALSILEATYFLMESYNE